MILVLSELIRCLEEAFPLSFQEGYDNSGLQTGSAQQEIQSVLITLDVTEQVIDEAVAKGAGLILSHHPLIFQGLKKLNGNGYVERCVIKAIRNNIALYACHTNADNLREGLNAALARRLGLTNCRILKPLKGQLRKLVTFVPHEQADQVRQAVFSAGGGTIGEYDSCSYNLQGHGTFRGSANTNPFAGGKGVFHTEPETRIETIFPAHLQARVIKAMLAAHPYEEAAYDIYTLENEYEKAGAGLIGELDPGSGGEAFARLVKERLGAETLRHTAFLPGDIKKVALCGGSGAFLIPEAIRQGANAFVTADLKYHQFFDADGRILLIDAGHFETEQVVKELFYEVLIKNFPNFAVHFSEVNTNPVNYI
ncbi:MAG: Nif3-like dinuclear metal center hexameric protein [Bacteroidales bacterium]